MRLPIHSGTSWYNTRKRVPIPLQVPMKFDYEFMSVRQEYPMTVRYMMTFSINRPVEIRMDIGGDSVEHHLEHAMENFKRQCVRDLYGPIQNILLDVRDDLLNYRNNEADQKITTIMDLIDDNPIEM